MIIKCKMCSGNIEFKPGDTYGKCAYCGNISTIPRKARAEARVKENPSVKRKPGKKRIAVIGILAAVAVIAAIIVGTKVITPGNKYRKAEELRAAGQYAEAVAVFTELGDYRDAAEQAAATHYAEGEARRAEGDWTGAKAAFAQAGDYSDAAVQINATCYAEGEARRAEGEWTGAEAAFAQAGDYSDAAVQITETQYRHAKELEAAKDIDGAAAIYHTIEGYKDVDQLLINIQNMKAAAHETAIAPFKEVGSYVTFGSYEQDNDLDNGKEAIEWLVLDVQEEKALLISRYALDCQPYNASHEDTTWETCTLRAWLNSTFIDNAFTTEEQKAVKTTNVNLSSPNQDIDCEKNTQDKVFLLSVVETRKCFENYDAQTCQPTKYAVSRNAFYETENGNCWWWLRSLERVANTPAVRAVDQNGYNHRINVYEDGVSVRPAFWLNLSSDIF